MTNVIPFRPDIFRQLYELIDSIHDTNPSSETKRIIDEALILVQKMIEKRNMTRDIFWGSVEEIRHDVEYQGDYDIGTLKQDRGDGSPAGGPKPA